MALHGSAKGGSFTPVAETLHPATCISVYDLGTHRNEKYQKDERKVMIQFELADEEREFEGEKYRVKVSQDFTLSMGTKANLRKLVESWRGKKFPTDAEAEAFDVLVLAGKPCMVQTSNTEKGGKTYCNISAVVSVPVGMTVPPPLAKVQTYEMGQALPASLPEWIVLKITSAPEFCDDTAPPIGNGDDTAPF